MSTEGTKKDDPTRDYMDDPNIKWRTERPNYSVVNRKYLRERIKNHAEGSLEKVVENLVKTWEMESTHKVTPQDWKTVNHEVYKFSMNDGEQYDLIGNIERGNYQMMLVGCPLYDSNKETFATSHDLFKSCFPDGFAWELLELHSGPPTVVFTWRHWGTFDGPFRGHKPTNKVLEMRGAAIVKVDEDLKITDLRVYFDPNPMLGELMGHLPSACPFNIHV